MADNITVNTLTGAPVVATDQNPGGASEHYQLVKPVWGPLNTFNIVDDASGKRLPVALQESSLLGAQADAADTTATDTASLFAFLKGLVKILADVWVSASHWLLVKVAALVDSGGTDMTDTTNHALKVAIVANSAGSAVVTDAETIARNDANTAKVAGAIYHGDGTGLATNVRKITQGFSNNLSVTEHAANGTSTINQVTVDSSTANGVQCVAANANRRRVVLINEGSTAVRYQVGNITAGSTTLGGLLAGVAGATVSLFTTQTVRATCATGSQTITVIEEILG